MDSDGKLAMSVYCKALNEHDGSAESKKAVREAHAGIVPFMVHGTLPIELVLHGKKLLGKR